QPAARIRTPAGARPGELPRLLRDDRHVLDRLPPHHRVLRSARPRRAILFSEALAPEGRVLDLQPAARPAGVGPAVEEEWLRHFRQLQPVLPDHERGAGPLAAPAERGAALAAFDR